jgi:NodT family efflux transporter outer membrane factor (OMF) lipoprotein
MLADSAPCHWASVGRSRISASVGGARGEQGRIGTRACARATTLALLLATMLGAPGCMVGPEYRRPAAPLAPTWIETPDPQVIADSVAPPRWWDELHDPVLDQLVERAYRQNLSLQAAGLRVIQAQARRGIAIGGLFPQTQEINASYSRTRSSANQVASQGVGNFNSYDASFDAAWELDLWGKFRRGIEAADEELLAAVASYDDVLVSLIGEVAAVYVRIRVLEEQLLLARSNADIQRESLEVARARFEAGGTSDLDVQQATSLLEDTEADIPQFKIDLRQAENALSVLLGMPPSDLTTLLSGSSGIPAPPPTILVSIPAELVRRRPDVRRDERLLAAQSARIGVAKSQLFPQIALNGSVGLSSEQAAEFFQGRSLEAMGGPQFRWPVLNYGRLINAVRVEDAKFQEQVVSWQNTVLVAQREVENAIVAYLRGAERVMRLERSVAAANRAVEISLIQYRGGATDYTSVLTAQQAKNVEDRKLTASRGEVTLSVVALYKALGGGWEIRDGDAFVPEATRAEMRGRTYWGDMLDTDEVAADVGAARGDVDGSSAPAGSVEADSGDPEADGAGDSAWHWWWPEW